MRHFLTPILLLLFPNRRAEVHDSLRGCSAGDGADSAANERTASHTDGAANQADRGASRGASGRAALDAAGLSAAATDEKKDRSGQDRFRDAIHFPYLYRMPGAAWRHRLHCIDTMGFSQLLTSNFAVLRCVLNASEDYQHNDDDQDQAEAAAGVIAPVGAVRPGR